MKEPYKLKDTIKLYCKKEYIHQTSYKRGEVIFEKGKTYEVKYSENYMNYKAITTIRGSNIFLFRMQNQKFAEHFITPKELRKLKLNEIKQSARM